MDQGRVGDCRVIVHQSTPGTTISFKVWDGAAKGTLLESFDVPTDAAGGTADPRGTIDTNIIAKDGKAVCHRSAMVAVEDPWSVDFTTPFADPTNPGCAPSHSFAAGDWAPVANNGLIDFEAFHPLTPVPDFGDDEGSSFEPDITWPADQGITTRCNPPTNDRFYPDDPVPRAHMAAFLRRALG